MEESISVLQQIVPDIMSVLQNRYHIMRNIQMYAPVGRRVLADKVSLSERTLRTETDFLRKQGLLSSSKNGMELTEEGENVFRHLEKFMRLLLNMNAKEKALADYLNIQFCRIVPGDSDEDASILDEIGKTAAKELHALLPAGEFIVAV
ncbi:MAG: sugar-binding domain-containing protein, partial [Trichococcus flocculiformis]